MMENSNVFLPRIDMRLFCSLSLFIFWELTAKLQGSVISHQTMFAKMLMGYDSDRQAFTENYCIDYLQVENANHRDSNPTSTPWILSQTGLQNTLTLNKNMSFKAMLNALSGDLEFGIALQALTVDGAFSYASRNASTRYNETYTLIFNMQGITLSLPEGGLPVLSAYGERVKRRNAELILKACGDEYISQIDLGAKFFVTLNIEYASEEDKKFFFGMLNINMEDLGSVQGELKYKYDEISNRVKVSVEAFQLGGDSSQLSRIISNNDSTSKNALIKCTIEDLKFCLDALNSVIKYAKSLHKQFDLTTADKMVPLAYHTSSYSAHLGLGKPLLTPLQKKELTREKQLMYGDMLVTIQDLNRAQYILSAYDLSAKATSMIEGIVHDALAINKIRAQALATCYEKPQDCLKELAAARHKIKDIAYNREFLNIPPSSFKIWCEYHNHSYDAYVTEANSSRYMTSSFKNDLLTVHALLAVSGIEPVERTETKEICLMEAGEHRCREVKIVKKVYNCEAVELSLHEKESLDLTGQHIGSLKPLESLSDSITALKLPNLNANQDLSSLSILDRLRYLNLEKFKDSQLNVGTLRYLQKLDLSESLVDNLDFIDDFPYLKELKMPDTEIYSNFSSLGNAVQLKYVYLGEVDNVSQDEFQKVVNSLPNLEKILVKRSQSIPCSHHKVSCYD